ncbi:hypothetical protein GCM10010492_61150 [Saccharothrix mutabilis subsp. mutabilis]|uniref:ATP-binding protein n=1 Tax=Saccharothrix mutabilis subsp. mutabilis TaxID=66855 RepID=A0ABN0UJ64_9PSEU
MSRPPNSLQCPICLHTVLWSAAPVVVLDAQGEETPFVALPGENQEVLFNRLATAYRVCTGGGTRHYLPHDYGDYDERVVVGVIGQGAAGKSHLLAAMVGQLMRRAAPLRDLGLLVEPLDLRIHQRYMSTVVEPFLGRRQRLRATPAQAIEFADALKVTNLRTGRRFALTFFDVAGEVLERVDPSVAFIGAVNALVFVIDPETVPNLLRGRPETTGDAAFDVTLARISAIRNRRRLPYLPIPSVSVVAKADLLRFRSAKVDHWLSRDAEAEEFDLSTVEDESRDVYAYLFARDAHRWLAPAERCAWSTLHFASAAGTSPEGAEFPAVAFRQRRVLKPLLSLLAMKGVLTPTPVGGWV